MIFGIGKPKIQMPNNAGPPQEWTATNPTTLPRTRPNSVANMVSLISEFERRERYADAVALLKMNASPGVKVWLRSVIDPGIEWRVDANVDWEPCQFEESRGALWENLRKLYLWCDFPGIPSPLANVPKEKLYRKWGDFLSEHAAGEATILLMACDKRLPFHPDIAMEAFPELLGPVDQSELQRQNARRLAEREVGRLLAEKTRLENLTESEVTATQILKNKHAAMERMNELYRVEQLTMRNKKRRTRAKLIAQI